MRLAKMEKFDQLPVQFSGAHEYNFKDNYVAPEWSANFTEKFLFPGL